MSETIYIYPSKTKLAFSILGAMAFVLIGVVIITDSLNKNDMEKVMIGVGCSALFALCSIMGFIKLLQRNRPILEINAQGIIDHSNTWGLIQWQDIAFISTIAIQRQKFICIDVYDESIFLARTSGIKRKLILLNKKWGFPLITFNVAAGNHSTEQIMTEMKTRLNHFRETRLNKAQKQLSYFKKKKK
ncbi:STM3941 family protein [Alysiella crassa]|uniref:Uncharacterized protein n=1 Tax=Alysiella crassa TaxID=153491 RepID=A0A376BT82_9NEIS|nr:STM3941 family protein [Alysiella crassa]UOP08074.1 hypothetical protein LVJ80_07140 [Alysiella crassa]SSY80150.1 Uncharacterised protein [Alysiella crassa]